MKFLFKGAIAIVLILGIVKTFEEYDVVSEATNYYNQVKSGEIVQTIENINFDGLKNLDFNDLKPSDFF
ncbi:hypothetical protein NGH74_03510 [Staphylococcus pseudoxylosus]|uniref:hypothetical protein n=1 Tax=Staphylococcus pseudoxylosus TaxID=2282419 RepID=UPI000D1D4131|nr:hypothetical protein [Staphylococcus pseudoxylosus]PTI46768.1 hypothetical protein BU120_00295 [Staphylococcus xylosus]MDW8797767.1 hypothetical protein [Staphylococcus pseudoxylosus]MEB6036951.1 hypothetical protein [Staphylococcus pseudoxylosus]MEB6044097.1 hypothetical protein [Staphylococcus pseudoxylosus]MEB6060477.1 hypothetical protein [Staphylococcus pseudoxylosus]